MSEPDDLNLDRLIHEPARLTILTILSSVESADFTFLERATGLTKGNLSSHLSKLEEGGLVTIEKRFVRKRPQTSVALTDDGAQRVAAHWASLDRLRAFAEQAPQIGRDAPAGGERGRPGPSPA